MKFHVEPRLLDHFGVAMYNTIPKAIAELAANSYDADATRVKITFSDAAISILDNGEGMSKASLEDGYLRLGRDRRSGAGGERSKKGRPVIGNKGIGKLAGFGIAERMVVRTWRDREQTTITLDRTDLDKATDLESYEFTAETKSVKAGHGTEIRLEGLLDGVPEVDEGKLRAHLARHLPASNSWAVYVNGVECRPEDIPGQRFTFSDELPGFGKVTGYYIVATDRRGLNSGFTVRVRDRVVQEASLFGLNQQSHGYFNLVRIVGEMNPDFIDPVDAPRSGRDQFVINTSRSGFNPDDPAVVALNEYAKKKLETIASGLAKQRTRERKKAALKRNPEFEERLKALGPDVYVKLDQALESIIEKLSKNEDDETVDQVIDLIIRYYESDALRIILESIRSSAADEVDRLSRLLAKYGAARVVEVADLLHTQLEIIELLRQKVDEGVLEAEIHNIVAENVWLVREDLTYWFSNKAFSTTLTDALVKKVPFAKKKRPDLVCFDDRRLQPKLGMSPARLFVVEFKRPGVMIGTAELSQVMLYKMAFEGALSGVDNIDVLILGDSFDSAFDRSALTGQYQILSYQELLANARDRYRELYDKLAPGHLTSFSTASTDGAAAPLVPVKKVAGAKKAARAPGATAAKKAAGAKKAARAPRATAAKKAAKGPR